MDKVKEFRAIVNKMADTYEKKNSNYGDSFGKLFEELGAVSGLVPLYNKLHRATSLINGDENHFESLEDTLIDMACYAIMNVIEMRNKQQDSKVDSTSGKSLSLTDNYWTVMPYNPNDYTGGSITYTNPCEYCSRKLQINGCDGCCHNIRLTCTANGGTNDGK
jgi:hypothetical protein